MKQVLIVDDSHTIRHEIAQAMTRAGFGVVEAEDGLVGLDRARQQRFSVIILDVNMPRLNGLEMLEAMNADAALPKVPVLLLTSEADRRLIDRARKAGAKGWLIKPASMTDLVATVKALIAREGT